MDILAIARCITRGDVYVLHSKRKSRLDNLWSGFLPLPSTLLNVASCSKNETGVTSNDETIALKFPAHLHCSSPVEMVVAWVLVLPLIAPRPLLYRRLLVD